MIKAPIPEAPVEVKKEERYDALIPEIEAIKAVESAKPMTISGDTFLIVTTKKNFLLHSDSKEFLAPIMMRLYMEENGKTMHLAGLRYEQETEENQHPVMGMSLRGYGSNGGFRYICLGENDDDIMDAGRTGGMPALVRTVITVLQTIQPEHRFDDDDEWEDDDDDDTDPFA